MFDGIFAYELEAVIIHIPLKHPNNTFWKWNTQTSIFGVGYPNDVVGLNVVLQVPSCIYGHKIVFCELQGGNSWDKLQLLGGFFLDCDCSRQGVHVVIRKWFLRKWLRSSALSIVCNSSSHHWYSIGYFLFSNSIDISSNQLQPGVFVSFATVVVDGDPAHKWANTLILVQRQYIVTLPGKTRCSVGNLALSWCLLLGVHLPSQCWF